MSKKYFKCTIPCKNGCVISSKDINEVMIYCALIEDDTTVKEITKAEFLKEIE